MSEKIRLTPQVRTVLPDADREDAIRFCPKCGRKISPEQRLCPFCENTGEMPRPKLPRKRKILIICAIVFFLLLLLLATDLYILKSGPLPRAVPTETLSPVPRGTSVPVIMLK